MARKRVTKRKAGDIQQDGASASDGEEEPKDDSMPSSTREAPQTISQESDNGQNGLFPVPVAENQHGGLESDASANVSEDSDTTADTPCTRSSLEARLDSLEEQTVEDEEDEEEILVVVELTDFKNHPILDDYKSITIEGIDTAKPTLHIGEYSLHGQLEETVGTQFFYDINSRRSSSSSTTDKTNEYRYTGQTTKKIKFTIAPPDEYH